MKRVEYLGPTQYLAATGLVSIIVLAWLGYSAIGQWKQNAVLLANHRMNERADLFALAFTRDMQGAQRSVLLSSDLAGFQLDPTYDLVNFVGSAFARYSYPESFFSWRSGQAIAKTVFVNRRDRQPSWVDKDNGVSRFPVTSAFAPRVAEEVLRHILIDANDGHAFSVFDVAIGGVPYQVVARLLYRDAVREQLDAVIGFTVNLEWARNDYFPLLAKDVARVVGEGVRLAQTRVDEVASDRFDALGLSADGHANRRKLPIMFFDPILVSADLPADIVPGFLIVEAVPIADWNLAAANRGANWMLGLSIMAAVAATLGLALAVYAALARAKFATMRSEFVDAVTHELKTPIATIRAIGETILATDAGVSEKVGEYAQLVVQEAKRLTRSVQNLLALARVTDLGTVYSIEPVSIDAAISEVLRDFELQLERDDFDVEVCIAPALPPIAADRNALRLVFENLFDNAIRYSGADRVIEIRVQQSGVQVEVQVTNGGPGIDKHEIAHVVRRFYRGGNATPGGSGLGLAIVQQVMDAHGGTLTINSEPGATTVAVAFRLWNAGSWRQGS